MLARSFALLSAVAWAGCSSNTTHHLVAAGDALRYVTDAAPAQSWVMPGFDDTPWRLLSGAIAPLAADGQLAPVWARCRFDVGARYADLKSLSLQVTTDGSFAAWVNGTQVAAQNGTFTVPDGLLTGAGNVLALEVQPSAGAASLPLDVQLDGTPVASAAPALARGPWLTAPTPTSVTVGWVTTAPTAARLVVDGRVLDSAGGGADGTLHVVTVDGLAPSHAYPYHVEVGGVASEPSTLTTAPSAGERVRFVVFGDNRTDGDAHRRVVQAIDAESPDFVVNTGDVVDHSAPDEWQTFFDIEYALLRRTPLFPALGNHEAASGGTPVVAEMFPLGDGSAGGRAYGVDYGPVHLAVLDSNGDLTAQAGWLADDLRAARARGIAHLYVALHDGPFSGATGAGAHGSNPVARRFLVPVAEAFGVEAFFAGHDHIYERGRSGALRYFVTGGGGAPLRAAGRIAETEVSTSRHHYLVVDVAGGEVHVTAKDETGAPFDDVALAP